ncbi:MAG: hypothetical protein KA028_03570 [Candidatus Pacebacteria bacterium]|nr:hypothetical protein [Candidatus Paceibacterota bacterium]
MKKIAIITVVSLGGTFIFFYALAILANIVELITLVVTRTFTFLVNHPAYALLTIAFAIVIALEILNYGKLQRKTA